MYGSPRTLDLTHEIMLIIFLLNLGKKNFVIFKFLLTLLALSWERSGSVVECLTRGRGAAGSSLTSVTVSLSKNINPSLELVQPMKTRPFITERLLMGRKKSNQTNKALSLCEITTSHISVSSYPVLRTFYLNK